MTYDLKKYRLAKRVTSDLTDILYTMSIAKQELAPYMHYHHVRMVLENLVRCSETLNIHLQRQQAVLESKAQINEETVP